jgi:hypothetical protein
VTVFRVSLAILFLSGARPEEIGAFFVLAVGARIAYSQTKPVPGTVQVHMVITDQAVNDDSEVPSLTVENVQVKQGKNVLKVDQVIPARDDNGALQLCILIDDTCDTSIGNNLNDLLTCRSSAWPRAGPNQK